MSESQDQFYQTANLALTPVRWAMEWVLCFLAISALILGGVVYCCAWVVAADSWHNNELAFWKHEAVHFTLDYTRPSTYNDGARVRTYPFAFTRIDNGNPIPPPDFSSRKAYDIIARKNQVLSFSGVRWLDRKTAKLYEVYMASSLSMVALKAYVQNESHGGSNFSDAPIVKVNYAENIGIFPGGVVHILGMCIEKTNCSDEDMWPKSSKWDDLFSDRLVLTSGQEEAVHVLNYTQSDEFWLRVAHHNHIADDNLTLMVAERSRQNIKSRLLEY